MKDVLLNRSGPFWLATRKFIYFAMACLLAAILAERGVSDAYASSIMPHPSAVAASACVRMGWYLFLFLLPWEAYKSILAATLAIEEMKTEKDRADKFAHGFKFQQAEPLPPVQAEPSFTYEKADTTRIADKNIDWRPEWEEKLKGEERPQIGFVQGVKARANSSQTESVQDWCRRNGIRY